MSFMKKRLDTSDICPKSHPFFQNRSKADLDELMDLRETNKKTLLTYSFDTTYPIINYTGLKEQLYSLQTLTPTKEIVEKNRAKGCSLKQTSLTSKDYYRFLVSEQLSKKVNQYTISARSNEMFFIKMQNKIFDTVTCKRFKLGISGATQSLALGHADTEHINTVYCLLTDIIDVVCAIVS